MDNRYHVRARQIMISFFVGIAVVFAGLAMFNKTQRTCVDIL